MEKTTIKKTQIYVREDQYQYLAREARKTGSIAAVVRDLIDDRMRGAGREDDPLFSLGKKARKSKSKNLSVEHDRHLYGE